LTELRTPISRHSAVQTALDNINAAWKTATEAMYAQGEQGQDEASQKVKLKEMMFKMRLRRSKRSREPIF
jgi:hypothetical protein